MTKQKRSTLVHILAGLLILALIVSNVYFWNKSRTAGYEIQIGRAFSAPVMDENGVQIGSTLGIDFTKSTLLKDKHQINTAIFSLVGADSIEAPALAEVPDGAMLILDRETGIGYQYRLWLTEDSIIFGVGPEGDVHYRETKNAPGLREIIEQQLRAYGR